MNMFSVAAKQMTFEKFEGWFKSMMASHPEAEKCVMAADGVYADREHWAAYPCLLAFGLGLWTTARVEGKGDLPRCVVLARVPVFCCCV